MKKFSVVLLVAVLAVSSVFAALTGYVQGKYTINFDEGVFGYDDPEDKGNLEAKLSFDSENAAKKGEGKVYVDAAASFDFTAEGIDNGDRYGLSKLGFFKLSVNKLSIVGEDWTWNLLGAAQVGGYANSTLDFHTWYIEDHYKSSNYTTKLDFSETYVLTADDDYADYAKKVDYGVGLSFYDGNLDSMYGTTFQKGGYTVALAANGYTGKYDDEKTQMYYFGVESKEFEVGDLTAQAAFGVSYRDNQEDTVPTNIGRGEPVEDPEKNNTDNDDIWEIGASLKASYETDNFKLDVATDQTVEFWGYETNEEGFNAPKYNGDVLVQAAVGPVSADVFFAKSAKSKKGDDAGYKWEFGYDEEEDDRESTDMYFKNANYKKYFSAQGVYKQNVVDHLFSFQVAADLSEFDVPVAVKFQALNMINKEKIFNAFVDIALGDLTLNVYGKDLLASFENKNYVNDDETTGTDGSFWYWKENGNSQKLGVDATYVVDEALTLNAGIFAQLGKRKVGANVGATYVADLFTANASVAAEFCVANEDEATKLNNGGAAKAEQFNKMQVIVGATSDKLVDGAVLSIEYKSGNLFDSSLAWYDYQKDEVAGKLTTKCKVTF